MVLPDCISDSLYAPSSLVILGANSPHIYTWLCWNGSDIGLTGESRLVIAQFAYTHNTFGVELCFSTNTGKVYKRLMNNGAVGQWSEL